MPDMTGSSPHMDGREANPLTHNQAGTTTINTITVTHTTTCCVIIRRIKSDTKKKAPPDTTKKSSLLLQSKALSRIYRSLRRSSGMLQHFVSPSRVALRAFHTFSHTLN